MDIEVMTQQWSREELERAHQHYMETAARCAASGEWREWADLFTDDAVYLKGAGRMPVVVAVDGNEQICL